MPIASSPQTGYPALKGELKALIHISVYESNTLQEQDAVLLYLSMIP